LGVLSSLVPSGFLIIRNEKSIKIEFHFEGAIKIIGAEDVRRGWGMKTMEFEKYTHSRTL